MRSEVGVPSTLPKSGLSADGAICIAPRGMEEGAEANLSMELGLVVGEPATFRFFASSAAAARDADVAGSAVDVARARDELVELAPIEATLPGGAGAVLVPVTLRSRVTEIGTLELFAVEVATGTSHKLEFQIRGD